MRDAGIRWARLNLSKCGFSLIEVLVGAMVLSILLYALLRIWTNMTHVSEQGSRYAAYYFAAGRLLDQMTMDIKCAVSVRREKGRLELAIPGGNDSFGTVKVVYYRDGDRQTVIRNCGGNLSRFDFGIPPSRTDSFLFEVE